MAHERTEDDNQARSASSTPPEHTESTDISNDGPRQPSTEVDATDGARPGPEATAPAPADEPGPNGADTTASSTPEPPAPDGPDDGGAAAADPATTPEPLNMTTTQTDDGSPSEPTSPTAGSDAGSDAGDRPDGATTPGTPDDSGTDGTPSAPAAPAAPAPKVSHDPVTDAVTSELPAVPASVHGPEAPAGPPAQDPPVTTEMPRIEAPAASSGGDNRPVYEVRAAAVQADQAPAADTPATTPESEATEAEPPVTQQIPTVVERPSSIRDATAAAAATEATTTTEAAAAPTIAGPAAGAPVHDEPTRVVLGGEERPRHFRVGPAKPINTGEIPKVEDEPKQRRRSRGTTIAVLAPLVVVMLLIVAWAADTASLSGQVLRNVELAGIQIGGKGEEALPEIVADVAAEQAERPVTIELEGREPYETTTAALGLVLDEDATTEAAIDTGRGDTVFVRPLKWVKSFFSPREVPLQFSVTETQTAATLQLLQGADRTAPTDPSIQLTDGGFVMTAGRAGEGIDVSQVASDLLAGAEASTDGSISIEASAEPVRPQFTDDQAQQLADRANGLTANGLTLKADSASVAVPVPQLRSWIQPSVVDGQLDLTFNAEKAVAELPALFSELDAEPKDASMTLEGSTPTVVPGANGVACCGENAADLIWQGVQQEKGEVALEPVITEPEITTAEVESWGIVEPVGGSRGFQSGAEINGGVAPGFTTFHGCCENRVTNIHKIADMVRGTVIPPDGTFSVNDTVGQRTAAKGFVPAGAIAEGKHVQEIGGGVSQFATTTFNAAYFAGLDIVESQSHSEWFSRYPPGREATMGWTAPDLVIHNNTPYGVMIWTSYTGTSLTVTLYSTQWASAEQSGISESMSGACRVVTTTRTRSYPDGSSENDTFRSTYRPGEGKTC